MISDLVYDGEMFTTADSLYDAIEIVAVILMADEKPTLIGLVEGRPGRLLENIEKKDDIINQ